MYDAWRSQVERDLVGGIDALVTKLPGGLRIQPLYDAVASARLRAGSTLALASVRLAGVPSVAPLDGERSWTLGASDAAQGDVVEALEGDALVVRCDGGLVAHGLDAHDGGGARPLEVALAVARWLDAARVGEDPPVAVAVGAELFVEVAKLRALRSLLERVRVALGRAGSPRVLARTSLVEFSRIEPETNALRATLATTAALLGGADLVACAPYDLLAPLGGDERARAARLASTTARIATLESHLEGVEDPLYGASLVESLTSDIGGAAWAIVRELERAGGAAAAQALWRARLEVDSAERRRWAATGRLPRVGATRLGRVDAPMLGAVHPLVRHVVRDAEPFEALRDERIARATTLIVVGDARRLAPRVGFVEEVLGSWGAASRRVALASPDAPFDAIASSLADVVAICAEDADFERLEPLVSALAARASVLLAGRPGAREEALLAAGVRAFVFLGADLPLVARTLYAARGGGR